MFPHSTVPKKEKKRGGKAKARPDWRTQVQSTPFELWLQYLPDREGKEHGRYTFSARDITHCFGAFRDEVDENWAEEEDTLKRMPKKNKITERKNERMKERERETERRERERDREKRERERERKRQRDREKVSLCW